MTGYFQESSFFQAFSQEKRSIDKKMSSHVIQLFADQILSHGVKNTDNQETGNRSIFCGMSRVVFNGCSLALSIELASGLN